MLFSLCKCKSCNSLGFSPDYDSTVDEYMKNEFSNDYMLIIESEDPPKSPNYLIFKCQKCGNLEKKTYDIIIKDILNSWTNLAWKKSQLEVRQAANFEQYFTRYLIDNQLYKNINERDLKNNPLIGDFIKAIENEEAKLIKESNDKK